MHHTLLASYIAMYMFVLINTGGKVYLCDPIWHTEIYKAS